jgi:lipid A 3-O-deacylase
MNKLVAIAAALALTAAAAPALASELKLGVYSHDIDDQISNGHFETGPQIVGEWQTASLDELRFIGKPRVHLLAGVNTKGGTDYVAAGFSWRFPMGKRFYFEPGIGAAIHDGPVDLPSPYAPGISVTEQLKRFNDWKTKLDLGSRVLFEPELTFGFKATERMSAEISWIHMSHAQLAGKNNPGLGDFGLRLVYRFGADRGYRNRR